MHRCRTYFKLALPLLSQITCYSKNYHPYSEVVKCNQVTNLSLRLVPRNLTKTMWSMPYKFSFELFVLLKYAFLQDQNICKIMGSNSRSYLRNHSPIYFIYVQFEQKSLQEMLFFVELGGIKCIFVLFSKALTNHMGTWLELPFSNQEIRLRITPWEICQEGDLDGTIGSCRSFC